MILWRHLALLLLIVLGILIASCSERSTRPVEATQPVTKPVAKPTAEPETPPRLPAPDRPKPANPEQVAAPATEAPQPRTAPAAEARFSRKSLIYDRRGAAYDLLQSPASAMKGFPVDTLGRVDWVETLSRGLIAPRASISGKGKMRRRNDDIIMRNTRDMPWVRFPHAQHTEWLDCSNCHPRPFRQQRGTHQITMTTIMRGQHCGLCHDRIAFSIFACERCHSVTHPDSPPAWW